MTTEIDTMTLYLEFMAGHGATMKEKHGYKYGTREEFVLTHGTEVPAGSVTLTDAEEKFLALVFTTRQKLFRMKECFENATDLVHWAVRLARHAPDMDVKYGEGFAEGNGIPIHHGVMLLNGKPVDVTWREDHKEPNTKNSKKLVDRVKYNLANNDYFMAAFDEASLNRELLRTKHYGIIDAALCKDGPVTAA